MIDSTDSTTLERLIGSIHSSMSNRKGWSEIHSLLLLYIHSTFTLCFKCKLLDCQKMEKMKFTLHPTRKSKRNLSRAKY
jgi:hypothetical protein